ERATGIASQATWTSRHERVGAECADRIRREIPQLARAPVDERARIFPVAAQQLIAAFAGQHHFHVRPRELRHEIQRYARGMRDRFVLVPDQPWQRAEEVPIVDDDLMRISLDRARDLSRVLELAERALFERHREGLQRTI